MIIGRTFHFDAAHHLPNYEGKCFRTHGHTWKVTVEVKGEIDPETGFVIDLSLLKATVEDLLIELDHQDLNSILKNPTCELLTEYIFNQLRITLIKDMLPCTLHSIQVQEGEGGYAKESV